jgi:hypothetical protein
MPLIGKNTIEVNKELSETRLPTLLKPRFSCNEKEWGLRLDTLR